MRTLLATLILVASLASTAVAAKLSKPFIEFSPQGTVKQVRQVTARFAEPMVPLGDPRLQPDIFVIDCPEKGSARWIDERTWVFDFARDLPPGLRCRFDLHAGLTTLKKQPVAAASFSFSTGGPSMRSSSPFQGDSTIEEDQAFVLSLDAEADPASVLADVYLEVQGVAQPITVRIVEGVDRDAILATLWSEFRQGPSVVVQGKQHLPNDKKVTLVWGKGVKTLSGVANAQDQRFDFKTRKLLTANVRCERTNARAGCIPLTPIRLSFSAPVAWTLAQQVALVAADGRRIAALPPDEPQEFVESLEFKPPFAESATYRVELPPDFKDDGGRRLANADKFPASVKTDFYPPLAKFAARFGIIESTEAVLPVTVRSIEPELLGTLQPLVGDSAVTGNVAQLGPADMAQVWPWLRRIAQARRDTSVFASTPSTALRPIKLPKPNGVKAFEVVGIPLQRPGLYMVELASPILGASLLAKKPSQPLYVPTLALVTNLSVHFKWGAENSLVWVTSLQNAQPVGGAEVRIEDCKGKVVWEGVSDASGIARVPRLPAQDGLPTCFDTRPADPAGSFDFEEYYATPALTSLDSGLLVVARAADDMAFVHSNWNEGIQPWRFNLPNEGFRGPLIAHTVLDRSLLRAGDTVHMKHLLRQHTLQGLSPVPEADRPRQLAIRHLGSDQHYDFTVDWSVDGSAETTWQIPKEAKLGRYELTFSKAADEQFWNHLRAGELRVQEFRVPQMRAEVTLPGQPQVAATEVPLDLSAHYLAGGAAAKLPVVLRAQLQAREFTAAEEFEGYAFGNGAVSAGIQHRADGADDDAPGTLGTPAVHQRDDLVLDEAGVARRAIGAIPAADTLRDLVVEMEYRDPNGEVQTVSSSVPLWPAKVIAGIKTEFWASTNNITAKVVVLDGARRPAAGVPLVLHALQRKFYSHRKRLVGGFYGYDHVEEVAEIGELCRGESAADGTFECQKPPPAKGQLIIQATATDDAGHVSTANTDAFVRGADDLWFRVEDSDRIDLVPERRDYEPGETARLQARMPFRAATVLVTVEREGVAEAFVTTLSGADPVIEVPMLPAYAPNVFISALAVRGRVNGSQPTAMVDLGRPAFKLGIAELRVAWKAHALKVEVKPQHEVYKVRETARVDLHVVGADGMPAAGAEVAVAAVDEGLLELSPNRSWNLLESMMGRRSYSVMTSTAQMQVVGKRHYGLKSLPPGGGGGRQGTRELFDTLLFWNARVPLDENGAAVVDIPLNDSLTAFRIVALATSGNDRFGSGAATIRATQDLSLISAIAAVARDGDRNRAECTIRNTSARAMEITVRGRCDELSAPLAPQTISLAAGAASTVAWDVEIPPHVDALHYEIEANESGGASDRLRVSQRVLPAVPVRPLQATIYRWEAGSPLTQTAVEKPADALTGLGGIRVDASPRLSGSLSGVEEWMRAYPYSCLEQRLSRAVALRDPTLWKEFVAALPSYLDGDGLLKYFPRMALGSEVLSAYVLSLTLEAGLSLPDDTRAAIERGLRSFVQGSLQRTSGVAAADLVLRKLAALAALSRAGDKDVAQRLNFTVDANALPTSALLDWWQIIGRTAALPQRAERLLEVERVLRARLTLNGTTMGFSTEASDGLWWLMVDTDSNAARLLLHLLHSDLWKEDIGRIVRGLLGRQRQGHWSSTPANAWGRIAVDAFSAKYESVPVSGTLTARLGAATTARNWAQPPQPLSISVLWQEGPQVLAVDQQGSGNPWISVQASAALPLRAPLWSGYQIQKTITAVEQRVAGKFSRGDLARVHLEIEAQGDMTWVVVNDPIAAGCSHVGSGLARDSQIAQQGEKVDERLLPVFDERPQDAYRAYYELLPKGRTVVEYTLRFNHDGSFRMPPTRVEAMYAPEVFGELPNEVVEVGR